MRTRIRKLMYLSLLTPIFLIVASAQNFSYGQTPCNPNQTGCYLVCPGNGKVLVNGVSGAAGNPCEHTFAVPDLENFNTTGQGYTGDCDDFDDGAGGFDLEVILEEVSFDDTAPGGPVTTSGLNIRADGSNDYDLDMGPGSYTFLYHLVDVRDAANPIVISCCEQEVFMRLEHSVACNDQISVSMGQNCLAFITLDMLLEGNVTQLGCADDYYDFQIPPFSVTHPDDDPNDAIFPNTGPTIIVDTPGKFVATVTTPTGEVCEVSVLVEDKVNAVISCPEIVDIKCTQSYDPGDPILRYECESFTGPTMIGPSSDPSNPNTLEISFDFGIDPDNLVDDIQLNLDVEVDQVQDVRVMLVSPDDLATTANESDTIVVLDLVSGNACTQSDFNLELDDDHFLSHNQLVALGCDLGNNHAYCGDYQPFTPFSTLDGAYAEGEWKILIQNFSSVAGLDIVDAELCLTYTDGIVTFPYGEEEDITPLGDNCYEINFENKNCGPYIACFEDQITECLEDDAFLGVGGTFTLVTRSWTVVSQSSGLESTCDQTIALTRCDLEDLNCPPDFDGTEHAPFLCSQFFTTGADGLPVLDQSMLTSEGLPAPIITGYPESQFGDIGLCAGYQATFEDTKLDICGDFSFKVLREWTILDWCTGELLEKTQIIKVIDIEAPVIVAPEDGFEVYADDNNTDCVGTWEVQPPVAVFDCGFVLDPDSFNFSVGYLLADSDGNAPEDGEYLNDSNVVDVDGDGFPDEIRNLPFGRTWIRYSITDNCDNTGFAFTEVDLVDHTSPNAVCIEHIVVALDEDGEALVGAESFDADSFDNCGIDSICARRVDVIGSTFDPTLMFTCGDMGTQDVEIEVMVKDYSGNTSICVVTVDVQYPSAIEVVQVPDDITIDCNDAIPTGASFEDDFLAEDFINDVECPLVVSCEDPKAVDEIDDCGDGKYSCDCTVMGTGIDETYTIMITVENNSPFTPDLVDFSPLEDFTDTILESCPAELNLDPGASELGQPSIAPTSCSLIAVTYDDQVFDDVDGACLKILRTWTVIDWCTYDPNDANPDGIVTYVQVLKINDVELPQFNCAVAGGDIDGGSADGCNINTSGADINGVLVLSEEEGTDSCSELSDMPMDVSYEIDYNKDGTVDSSGEGRNANGVHTYGCHDITWTIVDFCDNSNSCTYEFCINDTQPPNVQCQSSAVTVIVDANSSSVEINAEQFNNGTTDNVTGSCNDNELTFTLTDPHTGESGPSLTFDCTDIPNGVTSVVPLQLWVSDEFGNTDFCEVLLILQDNDSDICVDVNVGGSSRVSGNVFTEESLMVESTMVQIESTLPWFNEMMTATDGAYLFNEVPLFSSYEIRAEKDDNILNGVSTLDLVLIQKHILGTELLPSAYKVIAADADGNGSVSAIDLITLRKIILGVDFEFPNDDMPWRFINSDQQFADPMNPFPINEQIALNNINHDMVGNDFVAVKIGDVNANAIVSNLHTQNVEERSTKTLHLNADNSEFKRGETVLLPIRSENFNNVTGYQFTLWINPVFAEVLDIKGSSLELSDANFGYTEASSGFITTSWNEQKGVNVESDQVLFEIEMKIHQNCTVTELLEVNSRITKAEAYDSNLSVSDVDLVIEGQSNIAKGYKLYQNTPNPFGSETTINFELPADKYVSLKVFDVTGALVKEFSGEYGNGLNSITVKTTDLNANGIFYYQLDTEDFTSTKKMIVLE